MVIAWAWCPIMWVMNPTSASVQGRRRLSVRATATPAGEGPGAGVGVGDWVNEFQKTARQSKSSAFLMQFNQPHSIYLEALSTRGLMGFASLLMFICYPAVYVWRRKRPETAVFRNLVLFTVFAMLISGVTDTLTNVRFVFMAYCILIGIGMSAFTQADRAHVQCEGTERTDETD